MKASIMSRRGRPFNESGGDPKESPLPASGVQSPDP